MTTVVELNTLGHTTFTVDGRDILLDNESILAAAEQIIAAVSGRAQVPKYGAPQPPPFRKG